MTGLAARVWALRKITAGDWLCWSNDRTKVWRFHQHVDGAHHGLVDCPYQERTFWRALSMPAAEFEADPEWALEADVWEAKPWRTEAEYLPTRQAAIDTMLTTQPERTAP